VHAILRRHGRVDPPGGRPGEPYRRFEKPAPNLLWQMDFKGQLVDNGSPWGDGPGQGWTKLGVWLLKLGVDVLHSRPYHPQTRGKNERFHRTLKAEVCTFRRFRDLADAQRAFDRWRTVYNRASEHPSVYVIEEKRLC